MKNTIAHTPPPAYRLLYSIRRGINGWTLLAVFLVGLVLLPIVSVFLGSGAEVVLVAANSKHAPARGW